MISLDERDGIAILTLSHGKANLFDLEFCDAVASAFDTCARSDARAAVVTAGGSIFSGGVDLRRLLDGGQPYAEQFLPALGRAFDAAFAFPKPLVAAVNGHAIAGGAVLAAAADFRLVADGEGRMGLTEILLGVPFPVSVLEIVRYACAGPALPELLYHGRTYPPRDAHARHLADEVVPAAEVLSRARALAEELARRPRAAFEQTKISLRADALRRLDSARRDGDPAWDVWRSAETHAAVEAYRARTLGAKGRG
jgi:enoyl-CoA hydratase